MTLGFFHSALPRRLGLLLPLASLPPARILAEPSGREEAFRPRPVETWMEAQIALARLDYSCGVIDGDPGPKTSAALRAFQRSLGLPESGALDAATRSALVLRRAPFRRAVLAAQDLRRLQPLSPTWIGKSRQTALDYESALELAAAMGHASGELIRALNPDLDWNRLPPGTEVAIPDPQRRSPRARAVRIQIVLSERILDVLGAEGAPIARFPVGIAEAAEKRATGELHVTVLVSRPNYTFDPANFPESPEARSLGRRLLLPPGPNSPVGLAWIGLDRPGYGIHGTPQPRQVGQAVSHGCFRLTNWDASTLLALARPGMPVMVQP